MTAMKVNEKQYVCILCKMKLMDPFSLPVLCLVEPFEIPRVSKIPKVSSDYVRFDVPEKMHKILNSQNTVKEGLY